MKTKIINDLTQYAIPDGEGFNALPIAFLWYCVKREENLRGKK
jgi:hypothetical protein